MVNVLVIGSVNMDVVSPIERLPLEGETLRAGQVTLSPGGKGANAAVAAARLQTNVCFVGCVGDDAFGAMLRENLQRELIDCTHLTSLAGCSTGTAIILLNSITGQNSILVSAGANQHVSVPDAPDLFEWADVLLLQLEVPIAVCIEAVRKAREYGTLVVLDPAPALADLPAELLAGVDIVSPNETELALLSGMATESAEQVAAACQRLINRGAQHVVAKRGSRGATYIGADERYDCDPFRVHVVDSTAAGDSFTAALALARLRGAEWSGALRYACAAGALACTRFGAQTSLPTAAEVDSFLKSQCDS